MTVVHGMPSLIPDDVVILGLVVIGTIGSHGGTGIHLTGTPTAHATRHIPHGPHFISLGLPSAQEVP